MKLTLDQILQIICLCSAKTDDLSGKRSFYLSRWQEIFGLTLAIKQKCFMLSWVNQSSVITRIATKICRLPFQGQKNDAPFGDESFDLHCRNYMFSYLSGEHSPHVFHLDSWFTHDGLMILEKLWPSFWKRAGGPGSAGGHTVGIPTRSQV